MNWELVGSLHQYNTKEGGNRICFYFHIDEQPEIKDDIPTEIIEDLLIREYQPQRHD